MGDAPRARSVLAIDALGPRFADPAALIADLVATVNAEWRRQGAGGARLVKAEWSDGRAFLETVPGPGWLTVDVVRTHIQKQKGQAA